MKNKKIPIRCKGNRYLKHSDLRAFQGNLKEMSKKNYEKLRESLLKYGWIAPVFVWQNGENTEILDGHGRLLVLGELLKEGYAIDELPVVDIRAETRKEAAEILLSINSHYQKITEDGFYEFLYEFELNLRELDHLSLPEINIQKFEEHYLVEELKEPEFEEKEGQVTVRCFVPKSQRNDFLAELKKLVSTKYEEVIILED